MEAQLWLLWLALELDRVGEAAREDGFDLRPRDRNGVIPWEAPSGKMNFSRSSRLVRPRAGRGQRGGDLGVCKAAEEDPVPSAALAAVYKVHGPVQLRVSKLAPYATALKG